MTAQARPAEPGARGDAARALWRSEDPEAWEQALRHYPAVLERQGADSLVELDTWYRTQLPAIVAHRTPPCLELPELADVIRWKMKRGEWRPRNLTLALGNNNAAVRLHTHRGFSLVPDPRQPVAEIAKLAGVGPATASAVLAAFRPDLYPFLDDLVGRAMPDLGEPTFTLPYYLKYAAALRERAKRLGPPWHAHAAGLALWSASGGKAALQA